MNLRIVVWVKEIGGSCIGEGIWGSCMVKEFEGSCMGKVI